MTRVLIALLCLATPSFAFTVTLVLTRTFPADPAWYTAPPPLPPFDEFW